MDFSRPEVIIAFAAGIIIYKFVMQVFGNGIRASLKYLYRRKWRGLALLAMIGAVVGITYLAVYIVEWDTLDDTCTSSCTQLGYDDGELDADNVCSCEERKIIGRCKAICDELGYDDYSSNDRGCTCLKYTYLHHIEENRSCSSTE